MKRSKRFQALRTWGGLVLVVVLLPGCARHYTIKLNNGSSIVCRGKPRLERGYYLYKDAAGTDQRVNSMRVREISAN